MSRFLSFAAITFVTFASWSHGGAHIVAEDEHPVFVQGRQILEMNDAGEIVLDESSDSKGFLSIDHKYFHFKRSFEEVTSHLTPGVEDEFDVFLLVNVKYQKWGGPNDIIPPQHMQILRKTSEGQKVFLRDSDGLIVGFADDVLGVEAPAIENHAGKPDFPVYIPVSTGAGGRQPDPQPYVDTFSGMFRVNEQKSLDRPFQKGMYNSLYVDIRYPWGKASGIAIHGTPWANDKKLGTQQSHGCVRISRNFSPALYDFVLSSDLYVDDLKTFDNTERLGPLLEDTRAGQKVLMIFFYGHEGQQGLDI